MDDDNVLFWSHDGMPAMVTEASRRDQLIFGTPIHVVLDVEDGVWREAWPVNGPPPWYRRAVPWGKADDG